MDEYKVWVLAPRFETEDPNLAHYYDFTHSIQEYTRVFAELGLEWEWTPVAQKQIRKTLSSIAKKQAPKKPLILNLCDGDEVNGTQVCRLSTNSKDWGLSIQAQTDTFIQLPLLRFR